MATEFLMPKLGLTMEEGTILAWLVTDGSEVRPGQPVLSIETDKVESEVEASAGGRLHQIGRQGDTFPCGAVVGYLLADGEEVPGSAHAAPTATATATQTPAPVLQAATELPSPIGLPSVGATGRRFISPNARRIAALRHVDIATVSGTGPGGRIISADVETAALRPAPAAPAAPVSVVRPAVPATAAARQLADLLGIDLTELAPDPVEGYITRDTVARHVRARLQPAPTARSLQTPIAGTGIAQTPMSQTPMSQTPTSVKRMSGMRGTIAKRMHASLQEMAQLTLTMDAEMDEVCSDRDERSFAGRPPGITDYIVAATARALRIHPGLNAQITTDGVASLPDIHIGLAVALDDGLMVPVVRHADRLGLAALATETGRLVAAVRDGSITFAELEGGTFSVTALGMFGVDAFTPVINPPNVAILGVGRLRDELVLIDGEVATIKRLTLSLTWDHRALDGAPAAAFCATVVKLLEDPSQLA